MHTICLTIDGATVRAAPNSSVLDAAMEYGICIPHLCHYPSLSDVGVCRLCIVEHEVGGRRKVTTSCTLTVNEGMVIHTDTDKIPRLRRHVAELLVAEAPNSRSIQDIALRCGVTSVRYPFRNSDCVQCGRCVRVCAQTWQAHAVDFVGRGADRRREHPFGRGRPPTCKECNTCIDICPMTLPPCPGPMAPGQEYLCARCESQLSMNRNIPASCVWCDLGKGFQCARQLAAAGR